MLATENFQERSKHRTAPQGQNFRQCLRLNLNLHGNNHRATPQPQQHTYTTSTCTSTDNARRPGCIFVPRHVDIGGQRSLANRCRRFCPESTASITTARGVLREGGQTEDPIHERRQQNASPGGETPRLEKKQFGPGGTRSYKGERKQNQPLQL